MFLFVCSCGSSCSSCSPADMCELLCARFGRAALKGFMFRNHKRKREKEVSQHTNTYTNTCLYLKRDTLASFTKLRDTASRTLSTLVCCSDFLVCVFISLHYSQLLPFNHRWYCPNENRGCPVFFACTSTGSKRRHVDRCLFRHKSVRMTHEQMMARKLEQMKESAMRMIRGDEDNNEAAESSAAVSAKKNCIHSVAASIRCHRAPPSDAHSFVPSASSLAQTNTSSASAVSLREKRACKRQKKESITACDTFSPTATPVLLVPSSSLPLSSSSCSSSFPVAASASNPSLDGTLAAHFFAVRPLSSYEQPVNVTAWPARVLKQQKVHQAQGNSRKKEGYAKKCALLAMNNNQGQLQQAKVKLNKYRLNAPVMVATSSSGSSCAALALQSPPRATNTTGIKRKFLCGGAAGETAAEAGVSVSTATTPAAEQQIQYVQQTHQARPQAQHHHQCTACISPLDHHSDVSSHDASSMLIQPPMYIAEATMDEAANKPGQRQHQLAQSYSFDLPLFSVSRPSLFPPSLSTPSPSRRLSLEHHTWKTPIRTDLWGSSEHIDYAHSSPSAVKEINLFRTPAPINIDQLNQRQAQQIQGSDAQSESESQSQSNQSVNLNLNLISDDPVHTFHCHPHIASHSLSVQLDHPAHGAAQSLSALLHRSQFQHQLQLLQANEQANSEQEQLPPSRSLMPTGATAAAILNQWQVTEQEVGIGSMMRRRQQQLQQQLLELQAASAATVVASFSGSMDCPPLPNLPQVSCSPARDCTVTPPPPRQSASPTRGLTSATPMQLTVLDRAHSVLLADM